MSNSVQVDWAGRLRVDVQCGDVTEVEPGHDTGWRTLPCTMISVPCRVKRGKTGYFCCQTPDGEIRHYGDRAVVIPPFRPHRLFNVGVYHVSVWTHAHLTLEPNVDLLSFYRLPLFYSGAAMKQLEKSIRTLLGADAHTPAGACRERRSAFELFEVVLEAGEAGEAFSRFRREYHDLLPLLRHIRELGGRSVRLEALAEWRHVSLSKLQKDFKRTFGMSLGAFLLRERLHKAARLLRDGGASNAQIADATGFSDAFAFSKAFKRQFNISPRAYRHRPLP